MCGALPCHSPPLRDPGQGSPDMPDGGTGDTLKSIFVVEILQRPLKTREQVLLMVLK